MFAVQRRWKRCQETGWQLPSEWETRYTDYKDEAEAQRHAQLFVYVAPEAEYRVVEQS